MRAALPRWLTSVALAASLLVPLASASAGTRTIERYDFGKGLEVVQVVVPEATTTRFLLVLPAGAGDDPEGQEGLASLTAGMLLLGPRSDVGKEKALELYSRTTGLGLETVGGNLALGFTSARPWINDALETLGRTLAEPHWSSAALRARVEARSVAMAEEASDPSALAWRAWQAAALGDHPAAGSGLWTPEGLSSLRTGDLRHFHGHFFRPEGAVLLVAGPEPVGRMHFWISTGLLGSAWTGARDPVEPAAAPSRAGPELTLVHYPGLEQAQVVVGSAGPPAEVVEHAGLDVLADVLASGTESRLNRRLRTDLQLTYGVRSWQIVRADLSALAVSASVVHDDTAWALREMLDELDRLSSNAPPTVEEVQSARRERHTSLRHALVSPSGTVDVMASLLARGWPPEDLSGWLARIDAVNTQFVAKLAADRLGPQGRRIVVVGDADRLEEPLRGLGLTMEVVRGQSRN